MIQTWLSQRACGGDYNDRERVRGARRAIHGKQRSYARGDRRMHSDLRCIDRVL